MNATPEERYADLAEELAGKPGVTFAVGKGFGSSSLKVDNKIFAMLTNGRLVLKLPAKRVDSLITQGEGIRFDPGHGRLMKEWLSLDPASGEDWMALSLEALAFVTPRRS